MQTLVDLGADVVPIMSSTVYSTDTRFGDARELCEKVKRITGKDIIKTIKDAEPIGPKKLLDLLVIAPCTGCTLSKIAHGVTDTSVTMAYKAHIRNSRPAVIAVSTNEPAIIGISRKNLVFSRVLALIPFYFFEKR